MQTERHNSRELTYSAWHRAESLARYIDRSAADKMYMVDLDAVEINEQGEPVALIETARYVGHLDKDTRLIEKIARKMDLPLFVVFYELSDTPNAANPKWFDISRFFVTKLYPARANVIEMDPRQYAAWLWSLRI